MNDVLYDSLAIPDTCNLAKRVFKKLFHENAKLGATDKKALRDDIDTITWVYTLKPTTINIPPYKDEQREYLEVEVLHVNLKTKNRTSRIAEIIHRTIPYPLVIILAYHNQRILSTAHKRYSLNERGAVVAEDVILSDWIDLEQPTPPQADFIASLAVDNLPFTNYYLFYAAIVDRLVALDCARLTGSYSLHSTPDERRSRRENLAACHQLEIQIRELKAAIKKETQFNRQVEMHTNLKRLEAKLAALTSRL